jgi:hypothetical protein
MSNNDIMKKLRVALKLRDTEIVKILKLADFDMTESELGAIFRNEDHPKYKECGDQLLRNFLNGLIIHMRGPMPAEKPAGAAKTQPEKPQKPKPEKKQLHFKKRVS